MGRKRRKGRSKGGYVVCSPGQRQQNPEHERFTQHLDRPGQVQQFEGVAQLVPSVPGVPQEVIFFDRKYFYVLDRAWEIPHPRQREYLAHLRQGKRTYPLYHGTREAAAANIVLQALRIPSKKGMFGRAVYLAPKIDKSLGFTDPRKPLIFVVEAVLGRVRTMEQRQYGLDQATADLQGFDTAHGEGGVTQAWKSTLAYDEYAVYDPTRIRIRYLLEYKQQEK